MPAKNIYEEELLKWQQQYQQTAAQKPADYQSQYQPMMQGILQQYQDRKPFQYDMNADSLYQQYKDRYTQQAGLGMRDTMGRAAAMTGGYGNTYAQTAGQQTYDKTMQGLNDVIPQLENRAYGRYQDESNKLLNQFSLAGQMEGLDYQKYQDMLANWQNQRGFDYGAMQDARTYQFQLSQFEYQKSYDAAQQKMQAAQFEWQKATDARDFAAAEAWKQKQLEAEKEANAISQQRWQAEMDFRQTQWDYGVAQDQAALAAQQAPGGQAPPRNTDYYTQAAGVYQEQGTDMLDNTIEKWVAAGNLSPEKAASLRASVMTTIPYTNNEMVKAPLTAEEKKALDKLKDPSFDKLLKNLKK